MHIGATGAKLPCFLQSLYHIGLVNNLNIFGILFESQRISPSTQYLAAIGCNIRAKSHLKQFHGIHLPKYHSAQSWILHVGP
jgi:hypothetical protein